MQLSFKKSFLKEYLIVGKIYQPKVDEVLEKLRNAKSMNEIENTKKLNDNYWRIRIGRYRMGIEYHHPDELVITIVKRDERTYMDFPPK